MWWPSVSAFLEKLRLPTKVQVALPPAFAAYESSRSYEKAFAVDHAGHFGVAFGQRNKVSAGQAALKNCEQTETTCVVYAIDNELAPVDGK